jgi:hypothetical protein
VAHAKVEALGVYHYCLGLRFAVVGRWGWGGGGDEGVKWSLRSECIGSYPPPSPKSNHPISPSLLSPPFPCQHKMPTTRSHHPRSHHPPLASKLAVSSPRQLTALLPPPRSSYRQGSLS